MFVTLMWFVPLICLQPHQVCYCNITRNQTKRKQNEHKSRVTLKIKGQDHQPRHVSLDHKKNSAQEKPMLKFMSNKEIH